MWNKSSEKQLQQKNLVWHFSDKWEFRISGENICILCCSQPILSTWSRVARWSYAKGLQKLIRKTRLNNPLLKRILALDMYLGLFTDTFFFQDLATLTPGWLSLTASRWCARARPRRRPAWARWCRPGRWRTAAPARWQSTRSRRRSCSGGRRRGRSGRRPQCCIGGGERESNFDLTQPRSLAWIWWWVALRFFFCYSNTCRGILTLYKWYLSDMKTSEQPRCQPPSLTTNSVATAGVLL